jgi:hypothetical protein
MRLVENYSDFRTDLLIEKSISRIEHLLESKFGVGDSIEWDLENDIEIEIINNVKTLRRNKKGSLKYLQKIYDYVSDKFQNNKKLILLPIVTMLSIGSINTFDIKRHTNIDAFELEIAVDNVDAGNTYLEDIDENIRPELRPYEEYLDTISFYESSRDWTKVKYNKDGSVGYIGKYQFGDIALEDIGLDIDKDKFAEDPSIWPEDEQDEAMAELMDNNWHYLRKYHYYEGCIINGFKVTKAGMLAGAHLTGQSAVKLFLSSEGKTDKTDGNGTRTSKYMQEFADYEVE